MKGREASMSRRTLFFGKLPPPPTLQHQVSAALWGKLRHWISVTGLEVGAQLLSTAVEGPKQAGWSRLKGQYPHSPCAFGKLSPKQRARATSPCPTGTEVPSGWQSMTLGSFGPHPESVFQEACGEQELMTHVVLVAPRC